MIPPAATTDDWLIVGSGFKVFNDPHNADDPFVAFVTDLIESAGEDPIVGLIGTGFNYGWPMVEALRIAAASDGGLNRTSFVLAQRAMEFEHCRSQWAPTVALYG